MGTILKVGAHSKSSAKCMPWGWASGRTLGQWLWLLFGIVRPSYGGTPAVNPRDSVVAWLGQECGLVVLRCR